MSADPAGTVDGTNLFAYVRGSPVVFNDPNGMETAFERIARQALRIEEQATRQEYESGALSGPAPERTASTPPNFDQLKQVVGTKGVNFVRTQGQGERVKANTATTLARTLYAAKLPPPIDDTPPIGPEASKGVPPAPGTEKTKEQSDRERLWEQGKAAGIRQFDEREFAAFALLFSAAMPFVAESLAGIQPVATPLGSGRGLDTARGATRGRPMPSGRLAKIRAAVERQGATWKEGAAGEAILEPGDLAGYLPRSGRPGTFLFRSSPTEVEVFEELHHYGWYKARGWPIQSGVDRAAMEIDATYYLDHVGRQRGWSQDVLETTYANRDYWNDVFRERLPSDDPQQWRYQER